MGKYTYYALLFLTFSLPFELLFISIASVVWFVFAVLMFRAKNWQRPKLNNIYLIILFFVWSAIGVFYSNSLPEATERLVRQAPLLMFPIAALCLPLEKKKVQTLKKVFVFACIVFCMVSVGTLIFNVISKYSVSHHYNFVQSSMYHFHFPYDTLYLNLACIFVLFGNFNELTKKITSFIFFSVIFLFGVRTGIATFLLITLLYLGINYKTTFKLKNLIIFGMGILLSLFILNKSSYLKDKYYGVLEKLEIVKSEEISEVGKEYHKLSLRQKLWSASWDVVQEKPLFGYGVFGEVEPLKEAFKRNGISKKNNDMNSHNQYLTTFLQHGAIGVVLLLFILLRSLLLSLKEKKYENFLLVLVISLAFVTESMLLRQKGIVIFALVFSVFLGKLSDKEPNKGKTMLSQETDFE